jgi:sugar phosphate permease
MKKIYYGWFILATLTLAYCISNGIILNTLPIFYPELIGEFGWNQADVTKPAQLLFVLVAFLSPFVGYILDKFSVRLILIAGGFILVTGIYSFSHLKSLNQMSLIYFAFSVGLVLCGIISSMFLLTRWFKKYRGLAVGIFLVGSSLGGAIFNPIASGLIGSFGWRDAAWQLSLISVLLLLLPLIFIIKNTPEEIGLNPDGASHSTVEEEKPEAVKNKEMRLTRVFSSATFYLLLFATCCMWFTILAIIQHQALYLKDLGGAIPTGTLLSLFFVCSVIGKVLFGWLSDLYPKKTIMQISTLNMVLGSFFLYISNLNPSVIPWIYAIVFGIGFSGTFTMIQLMVAEFYSGPFYGRILGIFTMLDTLAGALGIAFLGNIRSSGGSYQPGFLTMTILCTLAAICIPFIKKPIFP